MNLFAKNLNPSGPTAGSMPTRHVRSIRAPFPVTGGTVGRGRQGSQDQA